MNVVVDKGRGGGGGGRGDGGGGGGDIPIECSFVMMKWKIIIMINKY